MFKHIKFLKKPMMIVLVFVFSLTLSGVGDVMADEEENELFVYKQNVFFNPNELNFHSDSVSGAYKYDFSIQSPNGRNGIQPNFRLMYDSQASNLQNMYGYGWSDSIPYIERINKDGVENLYTENNYYSSLSGELKKISSSSEGMMMASAVKSSEMNIDAMLVAGLASEESDGSIKLKHPKEDKEKRTKNSKFFIFGYTKDGKEIKQQRFYQNDVNYFNEDTGIYEEIDTSLEDEIDIWEMNKAGYNAKIKKNFSDNFLTFINQKVEIDFSLVTDKNKKDIIGNKTTVDSEWANKQVIYNNVLGDGIDIEINLENDKLVKNVVIGNLDALGDISNKEYFEIPFKLSSNKKIDIKTLDGKLLSEVESITTNDMVEITSKKGISSFILPPIASDSSENTEFTNIDIRYEIKNGEIYFTKLVPFEWLSKVKFPVKTDATLSTISEYNSGVINSTRSCNPYTCTLYEAAAEALDASSGTLYLGNNRNVGVTFSGDGLSVDASRGFFTFDTSSIPNNASIQGVDFKIRGILTDMDMYDNLKLKLTETTHANRGGLIGDDFDEVTTTSGANYLTYQTFLGDNNWNTFNFNTTGKNWISKTGYTHFGLRSEVDILKAAYNKRYVLNFTDPYLEITYIDNDNVEPTNLLTEGQNNPYNVLDESPEFSAIFNGLNATSVASYYQIQVTTSTDSFLTVNAWDSEKTALSSNVTSGNRSEDICYGGNTLVEGETYYWRIRFWDENDDAVWSTSTDYFVYYNSPSTAEDLNINSKTDPVNITDGNISFFARFVDPDSGDYGASYRIQVSESEDNWDTDVVWDSQKQSFSNLVGNGEMSEAMIYGGSLLEDSEQYYWRIKLWDEADHEGPWSDGSAYFEYGASYLAKNEGGEFLKYTFIDSEYWEVVDKTGTVYKFGLSTSSKQFDIDNDEKVSKWMLEEIIDKNGNKITYEYYHDSGFIYPAKIKYTMDDINDGIYEIRFVLEDRQDSFTSYKYEFPITNNYRVEKILVLSEGEIIKEYALDYEVGDNGVLSLLSSFKYTGVDDIEITLPENIIEYGNKIKNWEYNQNYNLPVSFTDGYLDQYVRLGDVNADGLIDIIQAKYVDETYTKNVYVNTGNGWVLDNNYYIPVVFVWSSEDLSGELVDVNGDGFVDIVQAIIHSETDTRKVYINKGDGTGWVLDDNYTFPTHLIYYGRDNGVRLLDVNGDGLVDVLQSFGSSGATPTSAVWLNKGDGSGWEISNDLSVPVAVTDGYLDHYVRFGDVNADGLVDIVQAKYVNETYTKNVYVNTGNGWVLDNNYYIPVVFVWSSEDLSGELVDVNGDGFVDIVQAIIHSETDTRKVYINKGDGTGWVLDDNYTFPTHLIYYGRDNGVRFADVNGDGLVDVLRATGNSTGRQTYLSNADSPNKLSSVKLSTNEEIVVNYKPSTKYLENGNYLNRGIPFSISTVESIATNDGLGNWATTTYEYAGGDYYYSGSDIHDRRFAGFGEITKTDPVGNISKTYYHQGNTSSSTIGEYQDDESKIGRAFRTEIYDDSGDLYSKTINKWENVDLGDDRDFVKLTQTISSAYDGDNDHRDKASTFTYNDSNGNLIQKTNWGEVIGADNGTFTDVGTDLASTTIEYSASTTLNMYLPSREATYDQNNTKVAETKYYYDNLSAGSVEKGNLTKEEHWVSGTSYIDTENTYNSYGLVTQIKDPRDKITTFSYDDYNLYVSTTTNALSQSTHFEYDYSSGQVKRTEDANGNIIETVYDALDRPLAQKQLDLDNPGEMATTTSYVYDDASNPRSVKVSNYLDSSNIIDSITYIDGFDRPIQERTETEDSGIYSVKDYEYNELGQVENESLPYFSSGLNQTTATTTSDLFISYTYDTLGRVLSVTNAVGSTINVYDQWKTTITDAESNQKDLYNDAYGNLVQVDEHIDSNTQTTNYEYDLLGNLTQIEDALDNVRDFEYDALGKLTMQEDLHTSSDSTYGTTDFVYDASGNLTQKTDAKNQVVNYTYDDLNRVLTEDYTGSTSTDIIYTYDSCDNGIGKLCIASSTEVVTSYDYNDLGLMVTETKNIESVDYETEYEYDRAGNVVLITYPDDMEVKYTFNNGGMIETVDKKEYGDASFSGVVNDIDYNAMGQTVYEGFANGTWSDYVYDASELYRLQSKNTSNASSTAIQDISYNYDDVGNITQIIDDSDTNSAKTAVYGYDDLYRLTNATTTNTANSSDYARTYAYNAIGNITNKSDIGAYTYTDNGYNNPHAVTTVNSNSYTYDNNGNLTSDSDWTHTWDYRNRLIESTRGEETIFYTYDHNNDRVKYEQEDSQETIYPNKYYNIEGENVVKHIFLGNTAIATLYNTERVVYEDAEDGTLDGWDIDDNIPAGATITNMYDIRSNSRVINVIGDTTLNRFRLRQDDYNDFKNDQHKNLEMNIKFANFFKLQVEVNTNYGLRMLEYRPVDFDPNDSGIWILLGIGSEYQNGAWHSLSLDLQADLESAESGIQIENVAKIYIRGTYGYVDNIALTSGTSTPETRITYTHTDHLSGSSVITDGNGQITENIDYYPFGAIRLNERESISDEQRKFTGHEYDDDTELSYANARYYDGNIGRFISQDSWGGDIFDPQSFNKYAYARNNPLTYVDPSGNSYTYALQGFGSQFLQAAAQAGVAFGAAVTAVISTPAVITSAVIGGILYPSQTSDSTLTPEEQATMEEAPSDSDGQPSTPDNEPQDPNKNKKQNSEPENQKGNNNPNTVNKQPRNLPMKGEPDSTKMLKDSTGKVKQGRTYDSNGDPVKDIDFSDHGTPKVHPNPHQHEWSSNQQGNLQRGTPQPFVTP